MKKYKNKKSMKFYLSKHKFACFTYVFLISVGCMLSALETIFFSNFLSLVITGSFTEGLKFLIYVGIVVLTERAAWWVSYSLYYKASTTIWSEIAADLTSRSFELTSSTFTENNSAQFVKHIMDDPNNVLNNLSELVESVAHTISAAAVVGYIIFLSPLIGLLYIALLAVTFSVEIVRKKQYKKNSLKSKELTDSTQSLVTEIINSETDIKALSLQKKLNDTTNEKFLKLRKANSKQEIIDTAFWNTRCLLIEIFGIAVLAIGIFLMKKELITLATYIIVFTYKDSLYQLTWQIGNIVRCFTDIQVSSSRMFSMYDEDRFSIEVFGNKNIENVSGKISFENVTFAYSEIEEIKEETNKKKGKKQKPEIKRYKKEPILKDLSFTIEPNTSVAFVGKSGSGKSTILGLISKLIETDTGAVSIDDVNIKELSKDCLRENISLINQFPYIFDMTIKENLQLVKKDATEEEIWNVLERASFAADVKAMPRGLETKVGETGVKLSGGQRQRLAIARALLKQTKIILFDESTSSLDNFAQSHIQKSIEQMKGKHTVVIVAHRLSTIKNVDKIYFLHNGQIADSGTFDYLFKNNEQFKNMFLIENISKE